MKIENIEEISSYRLLQIIRVGFTGGDTVSDIVLIFSTFSEFVSAGLQSGCELLRLIGELAVLGGLNLNIQAGRSPAGAGILNTGLTPTHSLSQTLLCSALEIISVDFTGLEFGNVDDIKVGGVTGLVHLVLTAVEEICEIFKLFSSRILR